jgi:hypothetical protein
MGGKDWGESGTNDGVMKELKEKSIWGKKREKKIIKFSR